MTECCRQPFTAIEISVGGDVYTCCPSFNNNYIIGNIFETDAENIWYSDAAIKLREKILNNDYSLCKKQYCRQFRLKNIEKHNFSLTPPFPLYVTLAYDRECNLSCITCRDRKVKNSDEDIEKYNKRLETVLLPLLKNAETLALSGAGEAIYSRHSRLLIKRIAQINNKLLFNINTNGLLFNENNLKELGIYGRVNEIFVSLPAVHEETYNQIMRGSNLETVLKNLEWMAKEQFHSIKKVTINSVISKLNYKEIPALIEFAQRLGLFISLSPVEDWNTKFCEEYDWQIWNKSNNEYPEFVKIMKQIPIYDHLMMPDVFKELTK